MCWRSIQSWARKDTTSAWRASGVRSPSGDGIPTTAVFMATVYSVPPGSASPQLPRLNDYDLRTGLKAFLKAA